MDQAKCDALKRRLQQKPELGEALSIEEFFDGNDDVGSIGCNLPEHLGVATFHKKLSGLLKRLDVDAVYVRIYEIDPGRDCWPFTDIAFVVGKINAEELQSELAILEPDEVGPADEYGLPQRLKEQHNTSILAVWWD